MTFNKHIVKVVVFASVLTPIVSACGGGSGSCGKVSACGGDVVGNYNISAGCINNAALNMQLVANCPGATANASGVKVTGSGSFNADLTYSTTETLTASFSETIPASCLTTTSNGITITLTCAQLDQAIQQLVQQDPTTIQSAHCAGANSCTCSFTLAGQTTTEMGTYTTLGTTITMTSSTGTVTTDSYCVQGKDLHVMSFDMTMPMASAQADIVFTKI